MIRCNLLYLTLRIKYSVLDLLHNVMMHSRQDVISKLSAKGILRLTKENIYE